MRSFLFENIWLLSHKERRALCVKFHPYKNLIQGRNHTGKSTLIKTLFLTLGAKPTGELIKWDKDTISLVDFRVNSEKYRVLHQSGTRALFAETGHLIIATSDHAEWSRHFADITGFNLTLSNKQGQSILADPKCFFLPFYINQDGSWSSTWNTFIGLQQFSSPTGAILDYFSGIRPPEYYEAKAKRDAEQRLLDELKREWSLLNKAQERFNKKLTLSGPKISPENFKREIESLTLNITELNSRQETLRAQSVREGELLSSINLQINMANEALRAYESDAKYLRSKRREKLICPVCNAEHDEAFLDLLNYAEDARVVRDVTVHLQRDEQKVRSQLQNTMAEIGTLNKEYRKIAQLLDTRKGNLRFRQVVESLGAERAFQAFSEESEFLKGEINKRSSEMEGFTTQMNCSSCDFI